MLSSCSSIQAIFGFSFRDLIGYFDRGQSYDRSYLKSLHFGRRNHECASYWRFELRWCLLANVLSALTLNFLAMGWCDIKTKYPDSLHFAIMLLLNKMNWIFLSQSFLHAATLASSLNLIGHINLPNQAVSNLGLYQVQARHCILYRGGYQFCKVNCRKRL